MRFSSSIRSFAIALTAIGALSLTACGGGGGVDVFVPEGEIMVDNMTDVVGPPDDVIFFATAPAGTGLYTGDLLFAPLFPGEAEVVGYALEDFYDAEAEFFFDPFLVEFFDVFVEGGVTTSFEIF